ncbi:uncharacterized protein LOC103712064 isoform X2 [Phoenix dactylifera]|uniref:Uncharacterized protein LOC103712064 isoform X2 n=1 Tax=Phoenix dactylifera TaxID=42345 RepID=A0A8B8ZIY2_PHODC|nr:uncharacterized protein LOC103712064 isoform X2 [Phoenix dactylifera]
MATWHTDNNFSYHHKLYSPFVQYTVASLAYLSLSRLPSQWLIRYGSLSSSSTASSSAVLSVTVSDIKALTVGDEIKEESLPLNMGQRIYELQGLKESAWYEVKISYPASIPARFSIHLETAAPELWLSKNRRLLNTEKIIFKPGKRKPVYVVVTVEAEGVVAKPNVKERELVVFNIAIPGFPAKISFSNHSCSADEAGDVR